MELGPRFIVAGNRRGDRGRRLPAAFPWLEVPVGTVRPPSGLGPAQRPQLIPAPLAGRRRQPSATSSSWPAMPRPAARPAACPQTSMPRSRCSTRPAPTLASSAAAIPTSQTSASWDGSCSSAGLLRLCVRRLARACWALLTISDGSEPAAQLFRVAYDAQAAAEEVSRRGLPSDVYRAATIRTGRFVR
jgi:hypothetical protein